MRRLVHEFRTPLVDADGRVTQPWQPRLAEIRMLTKLPVYANNAAAIAGGLAVDDLYRDGGDPDHICVVH